MNLDQFTDFAMQSPMNSSCFWLSVAYSPSIYVLRVCSHTWSSSQEASVYRWPQLESTHIDKVSPQVPRI